MRERSGVISLTKGDRPVAWAPRPAPPPPPGSKHGLSRAVNPGVRQFLAPGQLTGCVSGLCGAVGGVWLWDLTTGKELRTFAGSVRMVAYNDKAKLAAAAGADGTARLWRLDTGQEVHRRAGHDGVGDLSVCFAPDGTRVA